MRPVSTQEPAAALADAPPAPSLDSDVDAAIASDAIGSLFHLSQFLEQFMVQALVPLSVLYLVIAHSCAAAANVLSVPRPFHGGFAAIFATAQLISMMPIAVLVCWCMRGPANAEGDAGTAVLRVDVIAIAAIFVMHRLAICIKYAFQPRAVYARRMALWVTYQERLDDQLFASWFKLTKPTIEREVKAAVATLTEDEASAAFELPPASLARLRAGMHADARADLAGLDGGGEGATPPPGARVRLPASTLAAVLLSHVNEVTSWQVLGLQRATSAAGMVSMFSTTILRGALGLPVLGNTPLETCIIASAWVSNLLLLPTVFTFLSVGVVDHSRRERALEALSRLCRTSSLATGSTRALAVGMLAEAVQPPTLPLECVGDVRAFLATRSLLLNFGASFHSRLVVVIISDLAVTLGVAAYCIFTILTASISVSAAAIVAPLTLYHALVLPALVLCALGLFTAARTNFAAAAGATVVAQARLLVRIKGANSGVADEGAQVALISLMDDVERLLRDTAVVPPVTVLGLAATPSLTNAVLGGLFSLETLLVSGVATRLAVAPAGQPAGPAPDAAAVAAGASPSVSPSPSPSPSPPIALGPGGIDAPSALSVGYFFAGLIGAMVAAALAMRLSKRGGGRGVVVEAVAAAAAAAAADKAPAAEVVVTRDNPLAARKPPGEAPPAEWVRRSDQSGDQWWENTRTGETSWEKPR